jgi:hypothetical protein
VRVGRSRSEPVRSARKCLLQPVIQGRSGPYRFSLYRSVTPEDAGFESRRYRRNPCKSPCCVVRMDATWAPATQNFLDATTKRPKTARYAVATRRFQADSGRVQADREGGVRLHRMTGGHGNCERWQGRPAVVVFCSCFPCPVVIALTPVRLPTVLVTAASSDRA